MEYEINSSRIQGWNGVTLVTEERYGTFPRVDSYPENTLITVDGRTRYQRFIHHHDHKRKQERLLCKDGAYTLISRNIPNLTWRFLSDFWNTMLDMQWITILFFFLCSSFGIWLVFAVIFWTISWVHGDFDAVNLANPQWTPCIYFENNSTSFTSAFLFSVETLRTIGYGTPRFPTEECGSTLFFLCFGLIMSCLLESVLVGLLLAKTHIPQQRTSTLLFSQYATICTRNHQMCLLFRIGNIRSSQLLRIALKAFLVYAKRTDEGEDMPFHQHEINVQIDCNGENVILGLPVTACHVIDSSSPFYHLSRENLYRAAFEVIVILEGIVESTGSSIQARTSYVPSEILWGRRFESLYIASADRHKTFDYSRFDSTEEQPEMKDFSAYELDERALLTSKLDLITPIPTPVILLSMAEGDEVDSGLKPEAELSPSLAKALDIPYDVLLNRSRTALRRASYATPRRLSIAARDSVDDHEEDDAEGLNLPHPCNSVNMDYIGVPGSGRPRRISVSRGLRSAASMGALHIPASRKNSSPC